MLQLNMNVIDDSIKESDQIAIQVALNDYVYRFLTSEVQNSYAIVSEIYQLLSTLVNNSKYIKSIYVYDIARGASLPSRRATAPASLPSSIPNGPA
ncbi:hypothetical protein LJK87_22660 [Paenibacillus sp. P25]|nr:hypothetical protein LJK87_22660 [Paenibacillus sp. P25]